MRAADHPDRCQPLQPPPAGILRQADLFGEIPLRQMGIALQLRQDLQIKFIDFFCSIYHMTQKHQKMTENK
jgi:hypothetical protein